MTLKRLLVRATAFPANYEFLPLSENLLSDGHVNNPQLNTLSYKLFSLRVFVISLNTNHRPVYRTRFFDKDLKQIENKCAKPEYLQKKKNYYYSAKLKRIMFCIKNYNDNKIHHNLLLPFFLHSASYR